MAHPRTGRRTSSGLVGRLFTLDHANSAIPYVRRIVADVVSARKRAADLQSTASASGVSLAARGGPQSEYKSLLERLQELQSELQSVGVKLVDEAAGLVDFPSEHRGRPIFLTYHFPQDRILHYHPKDSSGRLPVESLQDRPA